MLPVKEMYVMNINYSEDPYSGYDRHHFVWMVRWLQLCMELSEVRKTSLKFVYVMMVLTPFRYYNV